jgi:tetratricopeptide (TPR) repeat protein
MASSGDPIESDLLDSLEAALLKAFRNKYGDQCGSEDAYMYLASKYGSEAVQAFLDYVISAESCHIDTAVRDLSRFFVDCLVDSEAALLPEFSAADEIISAGSLQLNMTTWEYSHIQCSSCRECIEKSRESGLSNEERIRYLIKALNYEQNNKEALLDRACYCGELGYFNDAISELMRYIKIADEPDDVYEAAWRIVRFYSNSESFLDGIEFASKWLDRYPGDPELLFGRARILYRANMHSEAMEDLKLLESLGHGSLDDNIADIKQDFLV